MNLQERIARRQAARGQTGIILDRDVLSPTVHREEPVGRGSVLEQLLDAVEPTFGRGFPKSFAVVGPPGSGTSAVITALFRSLTTTLGETTGTIGTTTRAGSGEPTTWFIYVDARRVSSAFAFYRTVLSIMTADSVPTGGVGTEELRDRLVSHLEPHNRRAVIAIDHHDEPETITADRVQELLDPVAQHTTVVPVGQSPPPTWEDTIIEVPPYRRHELTDILTERVSSGLATGAIEHHHVREVAEWADGNAHNALTALFTAATLASQEDQPALKSTHLERGKADVPDECIHLDRTLSLPETRQQVLCTLLALESAGIKTCQQPIRELAAAIAERSALTAGTVKRFLYELADKDVLTRVPLEVGGSGRRPSTIEPRFPPIAFQTLTPVNE